MLPVHQTSPLIIAYSNYIIKQILKLKFWKEFVEGLDVDTGK
jgi:hypothetical protein